MNDESKMGKCLRLAKNNIISILFFAITICGFCLTKDVPIHGFLNELTSRFLHYAILVLALVMPIAAGMGINFGIFLGLMAGQISVVIVSYLGYGRLTGLMLCFCIALPLAILFGYLLGLLYNRVKGQEMLIGLIVVYFANSIFQFISFCVFGQIIKLDPTNPIVTQSGQLYETIKLIPVRDGGLKYALDNIFKIPFMWAVLLIAIFILAMIIFNGVRNKDKHKGIMFYVNVSVCALIIIMSAFFIYKHILLRMDSFPVVTFLLIIALYAFNELVMKTKLGKNIIKVGKNQSDAEINGVNVNKTRIIATVISTTLAAFGQIVYLQSLDGFGTYTGGTMNGVIYSVALLAGGATICKANSKNAILGTLLIQSMYIMLPEISFGNITVGTLSRTLIIYGALLYSLTFVKKDANQL